MNNDQVGMGFGHRDFIMTYITLTTSLTNEGAD
jgi:hypothetical protein